MTKDKRVICTCNAYKFPHRIGGGLCDGSAYAEHCYTYNREQCSTCNCNRETSCDVATGLESYTEGECYQDAIRTSPGEQLEMTNPELFDDYSR